MATSQLASASTTHSLGENPDLWTPSIQRHSGHTWRLICWLLVPSVLDSYNRIQLKVWCAWSLFRGLSENCCVNNLATATTTDFKVVSQEPWKLLRIIIQHGSEVDPAFHCEALRSGQGMQNETTLGWVGVKKATWFYVAKRRISSHLVV